MKIRITPKTKGNSVNVRQAMSGKGNAVVTALYKDGDVVDGELTRNGDWFRVEDGYVRAELCTVIQTEIAVEDDAEIDDEEYDDTFDEE